MIGIGVDLALKLKQRSDYSALVTAGRMADGKLWILDAIRWRASWPDTRERIKQYAIACLAPRLDLAGGGELSGIERP